ncbi:hypothetical protein [Amaricoccus sp. W119]|uniref:hypothetical protein n=1 Tax=Amaricoccus sp. W119 TaxID=3391833 RepID=UPI0039A513D6
MKAPSSGIKLDEHDAAVVKGMLERGDRQHDIAAWFGVNGGRIAEISNGSKFKDVAAKSEDLPPAGPYTAMKSVKEARANLKKIREKLAGLIDEVDTEIGKLGE